MAERSELATAWAEGLSAGKAGEARAANPYHGKDSDLAKEWDIGWREGAGEL